MVLLGVSTVASILNFFIIALALILILVVLIQRGKGGRFWRAPSAVPAAPAPSVSRTGGRLYQNHDHHCGHLGAADYDSGSGRQSGTLRTLAHGLLRRLPCVRHKPADRAMGVRAIDRPAA